MSDYRQVLIKCYIVVPSGKCPFYEKLIEPEIGIIELVDTKKEISIKRIQTGYTSK